MQSFNISNALYVNNMKSHIKVFQRYALLLTIDYFRFIWQLILFSALSRRPIVLIDFTLNDYSKQ